MSNKTKTLIIQSFLLVLFIVPMNFISFYGPSATLAEPKFIVASWEYPDEYGQGIYSITPDENSSGYWSHIETGPGFIYSTSENNSFSVNASCSIRLDVRVFLNYTLLGLTEPDDFLLGLNYIRLNVTVSVLSNSTYYSIQGMTYDEGMGGLYATGLWWYSFVDVLEFLTVSGTIYTTTITYEVFYLGASVEYETDEQSIDSFSETLPNDVLFYPDAFHNTTEITATSGDDDYLDSIEVDSVYWETGTSEIANFSSSDAFYIEGFTYQCYGKIETSGGAIAELSYFDGTNWVILETFTDSLAWYNGSVYISMQNVLSLMISLTLEVTLTQVDFLSVTIMYMTLSSEDSYAESFSDVSDWISYGGTGISTDGDVANWEIAGDYNYDYYYSNSPSFPVGTGFYVEISAKTNSTGSDLVVATYAEDDRGGTSGLPISLGSIPTSWTTLKYYFANPAGTESIAIGSRDDDPSKFEVDYLRISPSNEMGWQHDCSTTEAISSADGGTITTDGDNVTLLADADGATFVIVPDTTTTACAISTVYYPFLAVSQSEGGYNPSFWKTIATWSDDSTTDLDTFGYHSGISRYNLRSVSGGKDLKSLTISIMDYGTNTAKFDYINAYSIANYTYTGTGTSTDDVLYVSDGTLYCSGTSFTSMVLNYDPALSVDTASFLTLWSVTTSSGIPQSDYYISGSGGPSWVGYSSETSGELPAIILTDVRIKFTDSANIAAITFTFVHPVSSWNLVTTAILIFSIPIDETAFNWFLVFLGLFMIPASTLYLVKGGKDNMSMNKVFFFIIAFVLGWALVIGGIFG